MPTQTRTEPKVQRINNYGGEFYRNPKEKFPISQIKRFFSQDTFKFDGDRRREQGFERGLALVLPRSESGTGPLTRPQMYHGWVEDVKVYDDRVHIVLRNSYIDSTSEGKKLAHLSQIAALDERRETALVTGTGPFSCPHTSIPVYLDEEVTKKWIEAFTMWREQDWSGRNEQGNMEAYHMVQLLNEFGINLARHGLRDQDRLGFSPFGL